MKLFKSRAREIKELQPEENEMPPAPEARESDENFSPPLKLPEIKRSLPKPPTRPAPSQSPPLFIKVDKYRDVVRNIRELRSYILNLRDALDVLKDMQREIANGIEIAQKTLDELNSITSSLDSFFMKPHTMDRPGEYEEREELEESDEVDTSMRDVYGQLEKLRAQLRAIG
jgi:hypothetical protein